MTNYRKGARFEYRVRDVFRKHGYEAERKAGSAPYDILVVKGGRVVFVIDAKKTSLAKKYIHVQKADVEKLVRNATTLNARPLVAYGFNRGDVYVAFPDDLLKKDGKTVRLEEGVPLEQFLASVTQHPSV